MVKASIIIPTFNKAEYLNLTLAAFLPQTYTDFEIIVVNDGSTDDTNGVIEQYMGRLKVTPVTQANLGRSAARNAGLEQATGDLVIFNDDDRVPYPGFVESHVRALQEGHAIIGWKKKALTVWKKDLIHITPADRESFTTRNPDSKDIFDQDYHEIITASELAERPLVTLERVSLGDELDNYKKVIDAYSTELTGFKFGWALGTTGNMSCTRKSLLQVEGFDPAYQGWGMEDTDLSYKLAQIGVSFRVNTDAINFHQVHPIGEKVDGSNFLSKEKQEQLAANVDYFCRKHDSLDAYLFWRWIQRKLDLIESTKLLNTISEQREPLIEQELTALYRELKRRGS